MTLRPLRLEHPVGTALTLLLIAAVFRLVDIFVLRLDERWGETILSKAAALLLLLGFLGLTGAGLQGAGFHSRALFPSLLLGAGLTVGALLLGYAAEVLVLTRQGAGPAIQFAAIDPKSQLSGAIGFALLLLAGNVVNSFAEEGLFRGVLIPLFRRELDPWPALALSALLFGAWHLPWAVKSVMMGTVGKPGGTPLVFIANFVPQALLGLVWGYLYLRTGNLWGSWISHTLTNSAVNFVHVKSSESLDAGMSIRMTVFTLVMLLGLVVIRRVSQVYHLPELRPWAAG